MSSNSNNTRSVEANVKGSNEDEEQVELSSRCDYLFEKELINKQNKHIHIMDTFKPSRNTHYLTPKFYARHEQHIPKNYAAYIPFVQRTFSQHETEASVYGWMPNGVNKINLLKELNFVTAPKQKCCLTIYSEKLGSDKSNARPLFNGLRFRLQ